MGYVVSCSLILLFAGLYTVREALFSNFYVVTGIFAPYLGPVIAFWFAKGRFRHSPKYDKNTFRVALACSTFFNIAIVITIASVVFQREGEEVIEQTLKFASNIATLLAFVVGPAIGFFFGKVEASASRLRSVPDGEP
jgi:uncharacterized Tic20 family protein